MGVFWITTPISIPNKPPLQFAWEAPFDCVADLCFALGGSRAPIVGDKLSVLKQADGVLLITHREATALTSDGVAMIQNANKRYIEEFAA